MNKKEMNKMNKDEMNKNESNESNEDELMIPPKLERCVVPGSWSEAYRAINEHINERNKKYEEPWFKTEPEHFAIVQEQWTKETLANIDVCVCGECKLCWPLESCDIKNHIKYIKLYGIDAYLIKVYGNNKLKSNMMESDEIYEAQQVFIQSEFFYC
uniref:Uncharacterized protein n=1 Tax=viral metagenome TaxID=1070528 RepID=A0A6C0ESK5_9ZZZZ